MATVLKGQSAGKSSDCIVFLSTPAMSCEEAGRALFDAHRKASEALGVPRRMLGRDYPLASVFPGYAIPSFHTAGRHLALADVAAMDAVEGRAAFERASAARFVS